MSHIKKRNKPSVLLYCIFFTLISCENFLGGSDLKKQLEADLDYANAALYEIRVECDAGCGTIVTNAIFSKKVTDIFEVEFKIADEYQFSNWEAYSSDSDGKKTELTKEHIEFLKYNTTSNDGVYKASVKYNKKASGIMIKPVCKLIPKITSVTPAMESSGCNQDEAIEITFNKAMDPESFGDFSCIEITDTEGNDLKEFFAAPEFSSDKKTVFITPLCSQDDTKLLVKADDTNLRSIKLNIKITGSQKDCDGNKKEEVVPPFLTALTLNKQPDFSKYEVPDVFFEGDAFSDYGITEYNASYSDGTTKSVSLTTVQKTPAVNKQQVFDEYKQTEDRLDITKNITDKYYVASSGAKLTQKPVKLTDYVGSVSGGTYYTFGDFSQTISTISTYSADPVYNGWYLGSDGYFYKNSLSFNSLYNNK